MNLDDYKREWKEDCKIDDIELDKSSMDVVVMHSKYQDYLTTNLLKLKSLNMKKSILMKDKWLWYQGKMDGARIKSLGWDIDPFEGLNVLKQDHKLWLEADPDVQEIDAKIQYLEVTVNFLKDCMENIKWRHQTIKNIIDWRRFMAGQ